MERLVPLLVVVTLAEMMFAMGLRMNFHGLYASLADHRWLVCRTFLVNYLIVPLLTVAVVLVAGTPEPAAIAFLILAVCPAAPYGPPFTLFARGNLGLSIGLMVLLAGSSAFLAPLLLYFLLPLVAGYGAVLKIDAGKMAITLFLVQLLPLFFGLATRQWMPAVAGKIAKPAATLSKTLNLLMVVSILAVSFRSAKPANLYGLETMPWIFALSLLAGWAIGFKDASLRKTTGIVTSLRNMSLGVVIAAAAFPGTEVLPDLIGYAVVAGTGLLAVSALWRYSPKTGGFQGIRD